MLGQEKSAGLAIETLPESPSEILGLGTLADMRVSRAQCEVTPSLRPPAISSDWSRNL